LTKEYNKLDIELYDFAAKEIFPKLCAKAGFSPTDKVASFDKYSSQNKPGFLLHRLYNQAFFRNVCKIYKKRRAREEVLKN
jgi:hypothetical protein